MLAASDPTVPASTAMKFVRNGQLSVKNLQDDCMGTHSLVGLLPGYQSAHSHLHSVSTLTLACLLASPGMLTAGDLGARMGWNLWIQQVTGMLGKQSLDDTLLFYMKWQSMIT